MKKSLVLILGMSVLCCGKIAPRQFVGRPIVPESSEKSKLQKEQFQSRQEVSVNHEVQTARYFDCSGEVGFEDQESLGYKETRIRVIPQNAAKIDRSEYRNLDGSSVSYSYGANDPRWFFINFDPIKYGLQVRLGENRIHYKFEACLNSEVECKSMETVEAGDFILSVSIALVNNRNLCKRYPTCLFGKVLWYKACVEGKNGNSKSGSVGTSYLEENFRESSSREN